MTINYSLVLDIAELIVASIDTDYAQVDLDADVESKQGFDPVHDGVWVRAWVKVPAQAIPGYSMEPPAPPSNVTVESTVPKSP